MPVAPGLIKEEMVEAIVEALRRAGFQGGGWKQIITEHPIIANRPVSGTATIEPVNWVYMLGAQAWVFSVTNKADQTVTLEQVGNLSASTQGMGGLGPTKTLATNGGNRFSVSRDRYWMPYISMQASYATGPAAGSTLTIIMAVERLIWVT